MGATGAHISSDSGLGRGEPGGRYRPPSRMRLARISFLLDSSLAMGMAMGRERVVASRDWDMVVPLPCCCRLVLPGLV